MRRWYDVSWAVVCHHESVDARTQVGAGGGLEGKSGLVCALANAVYVRCSDAGVVRGSSCDTAGHRPITVAPSVLGLQGPC